MTLDDWRNVPAAAMVPVYERERLRWAHRLQWDVGPSLQIVERARQQGTLPGLVVRGPGQLVAGWTYFVVQDGVLRVGALHAHTADGVRLLVDAIFRTPELSAAHEALVFVYPDSPACESALRRRGLAVTRSWYMRRTIDGGCASAADSRLRPIGESDGPGLVRLLARAYAGVPGARCFAPHGRVDEWAQYVSQLTLGCALGRLVVQASTVAVGDHPGTLDGAAVVTTLSPATLHLAQVVVDPRARRQGLARRMLASMLASGLQRQCSAATLLVREDNVAARALYTACGFVPTAHFLCAESVRSASASHTSRNEGPW